MNAEAVRVVDLRCPKCGKKLAEMEAGKKPPRITSCVRCHKKT